MKVTSKPKVIKKALSFPGAEKFPTRNNSNLEMQDAYRMYKQTDTFAWKLTITSRTRSFIN